jgi:hypothetical protein
MYPDSLYALSITEEYSQREREREEGAATCIGTFIVSQMCK